MKLKLKDVAKIKFCLANKVLADREYKILTPINLLDNNIIESIVLSDKVQADDDTKVCSGDIIVKRISPSFVNYIDKIDSDVYASGNLIIISAISVDSKYLAYVLNQEVPKIIQSLSGARIPAIGRDDLEKIQIPILPIEKQISIGNLWQKSIEIYKLKNRLNELELSKIKGELGAIIDGEK